MLRALQCWLPSRLGLCRIIWSLLLAAFVFACNEKAPDLSSSPVILVPTEDAIYFAGEKIGVQVEVMSYAGYNHMELFLDDAFITESGSWLIDTLIEIPQAEAAIHTIRVIACDTEGNCKESSVRFQVLTPQGESEDVETFQGNQAKGWFLSGWTPIDSEGFDDTQSLRSNSGQAVSITAKQFNEPGNISFHVKHGEGQLVFLVDGKVKSRWFGKENWGKYAYSIPQGEHIFKWIANAEGTYLDKISFTPGEEKHTQGEYFGGGTIFWVDSTAQHGLIATQEDGDYNGILEIPWGCYGQAITAGNRAQSKENGAANTLAIVNSCDMERIAARYCHDLSVVEDGHNWDDWYLPAIGELQLLYRQRDVLESLAGQYYWSSTSYSSGAASVIDFLDGRHHGAHRNIPNVTGPVAIGIHVRPVREF